MRASPRGATGDSSSPGQLRPVPVPAGGLVYRETVSRAPESGIWVTVFSHHRIARNSSPK
ncbi:MAG: hypothetical protein V7646_7173 [Pseudonocardia sp.]|jgi:hypothetical protein